MEGDDESPPSDLPAPLNAFCCFWGLAAIGAVEPVFELPAPARLALDCVVVPSVRPVDGLSLERQEPIVENAQCNKEKSS